MQKQTARRDVFQMRGASEFLDEVEEWRSKIRPIPSMSEAVKMLIRKGLDADAKKRRN